MAVLSVGVVLCPTIGTVPGLSGLRWGAPVFVVLIGVYRALVARVRRIQAEREMTVAFGRPGRPGDFD